MTMDNNVPLQPIQEEEDNSLNLKELFFLCLSKWYWFVISVVICIGLGVLYILVTQPVYTRTAQVVIKVDSGGMGGGMPDLSGLGAFDLFQQSANINNEIATFQSPDLMADVVDRLNLEMNYATDGTFHKEVLYGKAVPVEVTFLEMADSDLVHEFTMALQPDSTIMLSDFKIKGKKVKAEPIRARVNNILKTPVGTLKLAAMPAYPSEAMNEYVRRTPMLETVQFYEKKLTVTQDDDQSTVVVISVDDVSPVRAVDIINTLIAEYNLKWVDDKNQVTVNTSKFIDDRLNVIEGELGTVDTDISSFKSSNLLPDVMAASQMYMKQATEANEQILMLNNKLYMAKYVKSYLTDSDKFQLLPVNSGFESQQMAQQIDAYNNKVLERNALANNSSDSNPLVKDMDVAINDLKRSILFSIDNEIENINSMIKTQQKYENQAIDQIASNPDQAKYLLSVERQQKVKEALYLYLLQKREENELSQAFTAYNTRVITEPQGKRKPSSPVKAKVLAIALVAGILIPLGIIYLRVIFNTTVRGRKDLEGMSVPFVGEIPQDGKKTQLKKRFFANKKKSTRKEGVIVVKEGNRNVINEAFRVIRSNIEFMNGSDSMVIALTSANPGSGKTFITFNLATSFALKGKKILAVDLDIRKGSLSKYVNSPRHGVTDYIAGVVDNVYDQIVHNAGGSPLDVLPMGTMPPNPTELLYSPRFAEMIADLRTKYDIIFLDCPPAEIVADAAIIAKEADYTLFVIRAGLFERSMLPEIENFYHSGKYPKMSIILNGTENGSGKYGYRYGYRYGYGSGTYGGYTSD